MENSPCCHFCDILVSVGFFHYLVLGQSFTPQRCNWKWLLGDDVRRLFVVGHLTSATKRLFPFWSVWVFGMAGGVSKIMLENPLASPRNHRCEGSAANRRSGVRHYCARNYGWCERWRFFRITIGCSLPWPSTALSYRECAGTTDSF